MNKKVAIILSHCDTEIKKEILMDNLSKLRTVENLDVALTSHIILPESIIGNCDYFLYDKSNPILKWPQRYFIFWWEPSYGDQKLRLTYFADDYTWTTFNQILMGYNSISHKNYEDFIFLNYDLVIDEKILGQIKEDSCSNKFYDSEDLNGTKWYPSLIFYILNKSSADKFVNSISLDLYLQHGVSLFNTIVNSIEHRKIDLTTNEQAVFSEATSGKEFNNSLSPLYSLFCGYDESDQNGEKSYWFYNVKEKINIRLDGQKDFTIDENTTYLARVSSKIEILVDNEFVEMEYDSFNNRVQIIHKHDRE